jgi:hypothetical protein
MQQQLGQAEGRAVLQGSNRGLRQQEQQQVQAVEG